MKIKHVVDVTRVCLESDAHGSVEAAEETIQNLVEAFGRLLDTLGERCALDEKDILKVLGF